MKNLKDIYEGILDVDDIGKDLEDIPFFYKPERKWKFEHLQLGRLYNSHGQIGFYSYYSYERHKNVILIMSSSDCKQWIDHPSEDFARFFIAKNEVRKISSQELNVNFNEDDVMIQDYGEYMVEINDTEVPGLNKTEKGWIDFMNAFEKFFHITWKTK